MAKCRWGPKLNFATCFMRSKIRAPTFEKSLLFGNISSCLDPNFANLFDTTCQACSQACISQIVLEELVGTKSESLFHTSCYHNQMSIVCAGTDWIKISGDIYLATKMNQQ